MKIVIPVAGIGSRLKPHTFTIPKPLMEVAGKPILDRIIEQSLELNPSEIIFVVGYKKELIQEHVKKYFSNINSKFIEQKIRNGDGSAIRIALENEISDEELLVVFGDTIKDCNLKEEIKKISYSNGIIFGLEVEDPSHFGVMNLNEDKTIYEVEEKPENPKSNLAIIGTYYFKSLLLVKNILNDIYKNQETVKDEYRLIQVIEKLIKSSDYSLKAASVGAWYDCGRVETLLDANSYFLKSNSKNKILTRGTSIIIPPSFIASNAKLEHSVIGPFASIGNEAEITNSIIKNSVISRRSKIKNMILDNSLISRDVILESNSKKLNLGEKSHISFN